METFRVFIDESGDHTYKNVEDLTKRYLGITGVVIQKDYYDLDVQPALENIKKQHFRYDIDDPPILVRRLLIKRSGSFWVLREKERNDRWEEDILGFFNSLNAQIFTVVIDKLKHKKQYPVDTFDPYHYSIRVLLNRIGGYLNKLGSNNTADIMPECRGKNEDALLQAAYTDLRAFGCRYRRAEEYCKAFPPERLLFRKKEHNIIGLQIADLVAADQKSEVLRKHKKKVASEIGNFGLRLNEILESKVNRYGQYLLQ